MEVSYIGRLNSNIKLYTFTNISCMAVLHAHDVLLNFKELIVI